MSSHDCDIAIIGGGPAGSATACYLARAGLKCVVLERETFPREHVGESLVTSTTRVFKELGFLDQMEAAGFPRKYGAAWTSSYGAEYEVDWKGIAPDQQVDVTFAERSQEGVDQPYTYHVDRAKFDHLLLEHARSLGATVRQNAAATRVSFDADHVRVQYMRDGTAEQLTARMVVDASGRRTLLGNQLKLRIPDPDFDQYALHTWFEGYDRGGNGKSDFIYIHFLPVTNTWVWQIPITDTVTSIGVVTQKSAFAQARGSFDEFFWSMIGTRPELCEPLKGSKQLRPLKPEGDYSYSMSEIAGDRFVLVGDAARFVDPIFSSGVSIALNSARLASRDILKAAERDDFGAEAFSDFTTTMRHGCGHWYEFIRLYYRLNVLFTYFVGHPEHRLEVLQLLQGDVYEEAEPPVLAKMRAIVEEVEGDPDHPWHQLLGDLSSHAQRPAF